MRLFIIASLLLLSCKINLAQTKQNDRSSLQILKNEKLIANLHTGDSIQISTYSDKFQGEITGLTSNSISINDKKIEFENIRYIIPSYETNGMSNLLTITGALMAFSSQTSSVEQGDAKNVLGLGGLGIMTAGLLIKRKDRKKYRRNLGAEFRFIEEREVLPTIDSDSDSTVTIEESESCEVLFVKWVYRKRMHERGFKIGDEISCDIASSGQVSGYMTGFSEESLCIEGQCYSFSEIAYFRYMKPSTEGSYILGSLSFYSFLFASTIDRSDPDNGFFEEDAEKFAQAFYGSTGVLLLGGAVVKAINSKRVFPLRHDVSYEIRACPSIDD